MKSKSGQSDKSGSMSGSDNEDLKIGSSD